MTEMLGERNVPFPCARKKDTGPWAIVLHWSACLSASLA